MDDLRPVSGAVSQTPARIAVGPVRLLALALPMTVSHVTTPLLGLVGATAVGRLGDPALLGAVALGAMVFDVLFWSFGSLRMATAGLTAQAVGAGAPREADLILARALVMAVGLGLFMIVLQGPVGAGAGALIGASEGVTAALRTYLRVRILAAPFTFVNYAILGSVLGRGRSDLGLLLQVAINLVNIAATLLLVLGLRGGIAGAAAAAVLAEAVGVGLGVVVLRRLGSRPWAVPVQALADRGAMLATLAVNRDVTIRTLALTLVYAAFSSVGARAGDATLAANAVLQNILLVGGYFLDGFATAAETLCGQCVGAGDEAGFRRSARLVLGFSLGFGGLVAGLFGLGGSAFVDVVTTSPEVRALAMTYLPFAAISPLVGAAAFAFDGIYVGATWTAAMRNLMLLAATAYGLALLPAREAGNAGLWLALLLFLGLRAGGQALLYPRLTRATFARVQERPRA